MRTFFWWLLLFATTAGTAWVYGTPGAHGAAGRTDADGELEGNPSLSILARYSLGSNSLASRAPGTALLAEQLMERIDAAAQSRADRIRLVAMAAELLGVEEVRARIAKLRAEELTPGETRDLHVLETIYLGEPAPAPDQIREAFLGPDGDEAALVTEEVREVFLRRHGWFARLALTHGRPDDPERRAVERAALRTMLAVLVFSMGGLGALVAGLVLLVLAVVKWRKGAIQTAFAPPPRAPGDTVWLEPVVLLLATVLLGVVLRHLGFPAGVGLAVLVITIALPFWPRLRGVTREAWCAEIGFTRGRGIAREIGAGFLGYLAGFPVFCVGALLTVLLATLTKSVVSHPAVEELKSGTAGVVGLYLMGCLWAPWVEEMIFRGAFFRYLRGRRSTVFSALVVGFCLLVPTVMSLWKGLEPKEWRPVLSSTRFIPFLCSVTAQSATSR